ncbi:HET-domain-containing protein [Xylariaceae sp. FL1019]|nr:HET-domain-containing protein [Xylariaceae sp. FL1019]
MGCGSCFHQASEPKDPELCISSQASEPTAELCHSCTSITHDAIIPGAILYFDADPASSGRTCNLCAVVRGSYLEYIKTNLYWIHHPPKTTRHETTSQHLLQLGVKDITPASSNEPQCDMIIAQVTIRDTWFEDEIERGFYFHSSHSSGACALAKLSRTGPVSDNTDDDDETEYGILSAWANLELAKFWIRECSTQHVNCRPIVPGAQLHPTTRLIDTESRRLVLLNKIDQMPVEFVALSYVWGAAYQLRTTSDTIGQFLESLPRAATAENSADRMPMTMEDAIRVTIALGYRYLWVDAICIIQDSPEDLQTQVAQMNHIYGLAAVTIVARASVSSDSGLPGVSTPRDWLGGDSLTCKLSCGLQVGPWDVLERDYERYEETDGMLADTSCYMWRGWTFQEQILSTRTLEFNRRRLVFWCAQEEPETECGRAPRSEVRDVHHFRRSIEKYRETDGLIPPEEHEPGLALEDYMSRDMLIGRWNTIRENFTTRHFTYLSDRRNAVLGTASMLGHVLGDVDKNGHVFSHLGSELLWRRNLLPGWNPDQAPAVRLSYKAAQGLYPSWSWLSIWPLSWPSGYKPFPGVDVRLEEASGVSVVEIRGPSLEMTAVDRREDDKDGAAILSYMDGADSKFEGYLDRSLGARTVVTCAPIAMTIHFGSRMYAWCYGMLLLRDIGGERFERVGVAFANQHSRYAAEFLKRLSSEQARRCTMLCV